jgi:hypothetical protein
MARSSQSHNDKDRGADFPSFTASRGRRLLGVSAVPISFHPTCLKWRGWMTFSAPLMKRMNAHLATSPSLSVAL